MLVLLLFVVIAVVLDDGGGYMRMLLATGITVGWLFSDGYTLWEAAGITILFILVLLVLFVWLSNLKVGGGVTALVYAKCYLLFPAYSVEIGTVLLLLVFILIGLLDEGSNGGIYPFPNVGVVSVLLLTLLLLLMLFLL